MDLYIRKYKGFLCVLVLTFAPVLCFSQDFSDFFVDFLTVPGKQMTKIAVPLKTPEGVVQHASKYSPITYNDKRNVAILCSDSLQKISGSSYPSVAIHNLKSRKSQVCLFERKGKEWKLAEVSNLSGAEVSDAEFVSFLCDYSKDADLQMKRTIFPFPIRNYSKKSKEMQETTLLMPREWNMLDFCNSYGEICLFDTKDLSVANNRRFAIYRDGSLAEIYNFIRINKKWYLIEKEIWK